MDYETAHLVERAQRGIAKQAERNRFLELLEDGAVPAERFRWLAGELYRLVDSDRCSFAMLATRFAEPPAGELFLAMTEGEVEAMRLLLDFAGALGMREDELRTYEPRPFAQVYPAFLAQTALFRTRSAAALALLANVTGSSAIYTRVAEALRSRYGFSEEAVGHFRFFAETPQSLLDLAAATLSSGLSEGDDPDEAVWVARTVDTYEGAFWASLAEGLDRG